MGTLEVLPKINKLKNGSEDPRTLSGRLSILIDVVDLLDRSFGERVAKPAHRGRFLFIWWNWDVF